MKKRTPNSKNQYELEEKFEFGSNQKEFFLKQLRHDILGKRYALTLYGNYLFHEENINN